MPTWKLAGLADKLLLLMGSDPCGAGTKRVGREAGVGQLALPLSVLETLSATFLFLCHQSDMSPGHADTHANNHMVLDI